MNALLSYNGSLLVDTRTRGRLEKGKTTKSDHSGSDLPEGRPTICRQPHIVHSRTGSPHTKGGCRINASRGHAVIVSLTSNSSTPPEHGINLPPHALGIDITEQSSVRQLSLQILTQTLSILTKSSPERKEYIQKQFDGWRSSLQKYQTPESQARRAFGAPCLNTAGNVPQGVASLVVFRQQRGDRMNKLEIRMEQTLLRCPGETGSTTEGTYPPTKDPS
ncbi:hypothetical protein DL98DRAFT_588714 [Cadophora sp. DSE1049]|nr:hypothetical protein DL98DRAFT_588714 [Cadophora sp. DSE1049]